MAGRKRLFEEVDSYDSLDKPLSSANVHGVVTLLSPVKKGQKRVYFDGTMSDGDSKMRLVGFNTKQQKQMEKFMSTKQPVKIVDCEVKQARRGEKMEVLLKASTSIAESPKKIEVADVDFQDTIRSLDTLQEIDTYTRVTSKVKVVKIAETETVVTGKRMQEVIVADGGGTSKVTLWEEKIGQLQVNISYRLEDFFVREWDGKKYLSMSKESKIIAIEDIGEVKAAESTEILQELKNVQIIAVTKLDKHRVCLRCKARVEPSSMEGFGRCSKPDCTMLQRFDFCNEHISVKLLVMADGKMHSLSANGKIVQNLAGVTDYAEVTDEVLLMLPVLQTITHNSGNVITKFTK